MKKLINQENLLPKVFNYLKKYGLSNWSLEMNDVRKFSLAVVVPTVMEYNNVRLLLNSLYKNESNYKDETLIVFVVNNLANSSVEVKEDNYRLLELLRNIIKRNNDLRMN